MPNKLKSIGILLLLGVLFTACMSHDLDTSVSKRPSKALSRSSVNPSGESRSIYQRGEKKEVASQAEELAKEAARDIKEFQIVMTLDEVEKLCSQESACFHDKMTGAYYIKGYETVHTLSETGVMRALFVKQGYRFNPESKKIYDSTNNVVAGFDHTKSETRVAFNIEEDKVEVKDPFKRKAAVKIASHKRHREAKKIFQRPGNSQNKESVN
jgi:hypothetical protein